jgi:hypothetical protein
MGKDRFALETFIRTLDSHQERAAWVQSAHFSLHEDESRMWSDITNLCATLHSIHTVDLRIAAPHSDEPRRECDPCFSKYICEWAHLNALREVHVEDPRILVRDILSFRCLPKLNRLTVWNFTGFLQFVSYGCAEHVQLLRIKSNLTKLEFRKADGMPERQTIEIMLKQHQILEEFTWELRTSCKIGVWSPSEVNMVLVPLRSTLIKLEMSMTGSSPSCYSSFGPAQMDFANFSSLKFLKIHDQMMFARGQLGRVPVNAYCNAYKRLPTSLVEFEVIIRDIPKLVCRS